MEQQDIDTPKQETKEDEKPKTLRQERDERMLAQLKEAADKLDRANKRFAANQAKIEAERVDKMLDGEGEVKDPKKGKLSNKEYADKVLAGEIP